MPALNRWVLTALTGLACGPAPQSSTTLHPFVAETLATADAVPFQRPVDGVALADGRIAVADFQAAQVFLLRPDGTLDETLGRPGAGPGELQSPDAVVRRGDTLAVFNAGNNRIENFLPGRGFVSSRALPSDVQYRDARLLPLDTLLVATAGADSALAVLRAPSGETLIRFGHLVVPPVQVWNFGEIREQILGGAIPDALRNQVLPVADPAGDVWLIYQTEGRVERYDRAGRRLAQGTVPDSDFAPIKTAFFAANAAEQRPGVLRTLALTYDGVARDHSLWMLLANPDSIPPILLHIGESGTILERHLLPGAEGARYLIPALEPEVFYAVHPLEGIVFRIHRTPPRH